MMSERDSTPEEQETIQQSKDPPVIMIATGTTHATEEATVHVCDLDSSSIIERITRGALAGEIVRRKRLFVCDWHPGQPSIKSHQDTNRMKKTATTFPWWSQACKQPNTRPKFWTTGSREKLSATTGVVWEQHYQDGFNHSRKVDKGS